MAAPSPKPMVPSPPEVMNWRWAGGSGRTAPPTSGAGPTSVQMIASSSGQAVQGFQNILRALRRSGSAAVWHQRVILLPRGDLLHPVRMAYAAAGWRFSSSKISLGVALEFEVHVDVFIELGGINIDLDNRAVRCKRSALHSTRSEKRVPTATNKSQCFMASAAAVGAVHAQHAHIAAVRAGQNRPGTSASRRPAHPDRFCKGLRTLRLHRRRCTPPPAVEQTAAPPFAAFATPAEALLEREQVVLRAPAALRGLYSIVWAVMSFGMSTRTGPLAAAAWRCWNASRMRIRQLADVLDDVIVFGDRHGDAGDVDLLEASPDPTGPN